MKIEQRSYDNGRGWLNINKSYFERSLVQLVLGFGAVSLLKDEKIYHQIKGDYPGADIVLCSTAGEIADLEVNDETLSLIAIAFAQTAVMPVSVAIHDFDDSFEAGYELACQLPREGLSCVLLFSDGQLVNGSDLILALNQFLPGVLISGGMAGDGANFQQTFVGLNQPPENGKIVGVGLYGDKVCIRAASKGGWDTFGVERLITRAHKNVLYELDGRPALDIYKLYLGDYASELPQAGLFFPLAIRETPTEVPIVRTILSVSEEDNSLTFAGNMPEGSYAQLMKANHDRLIDGAGAAAEQCLHGMSQGPQLAVLVSCVGRKLVLGQRVEEEVESVRTVLGEDAIIAGFYSYGEFGPNGTSTLCGLHNQTMTITTISEYE